MRKRWASRAGNVETAIEPIEVASEDEAIPSPDLGFSDVDDMHSLAGSFAGSLKGDYWRGVLGSEDLDFSPSLAGDARGSEDVGKRQKTVVQVEDENTETSGAAPQVPASSSAARRVADLALRSTNLKQFKFPWEKGRLAKVFGNDEIVNVRTPSLEPTGSNPISLCLKMSDEAKMTPTIKVREVVEGSAVFTAVVRKVSEVSYVDERKQKRARALTLWWDLLATIPGASEIGRKTLAEAGQEDISSYGREILDACFGLKSPGTLLKRYYSMKNFHVWCLEFKAEEWLPMTEKLAWEYVRWLKATSAPATKATSFLESCRFCWFVIGVDGTNTVESSFRVKGVANQMRAAKRPWRPADLLTVAEVLKLHEVLESEDRHVVDRLFCGHMLHLLYGRARWSDLLATKHLYVDPDCCYLEVQTQVHKGAKAADTKSRLLPIVTPCQGISKKNWAAIYLKLRSDCGLSPPMETEWHMLPAPLDSAGENWSTRYVTSEEGAEFLRLVLGQAKTAQRRISAHSLKSTAISWTSKYGVGLETRAILARHATSLSNPTVLYSRDIISAALRVFDKVLTDIRESCFQPDRTRSGMITPRVAAAATPVGVFSQALQAGADVHLSEPVPATPDFEVLDDKAPVSDQVSGVVVSDQPGDHISEIANGAGEGKQSFVAALREEQEYSETSEEDSEESSSSDGDNKEDGEDATSQAVPVESLTSGYFVNEKSSVIHCLRAGDVFRCGKKRTIYYAHIRELNGMRCSRCFNL